MKETFCQTMVQGMLCGLPQITTDLEIFTEKTEAGGGVTIHSKEELIEAITKYVSDANLRDTSSRIAEQTARSTYLWDTEMFADKYL